MEAKAAGEGSAAEAIKGWSASDFFENLNDSIWETIWGQAGVLSPKSNKD